MQGARQLDSARGSLRRQHAYANLCTHIRSTYISEGRNQIGEEGILRVSRIMSISTMIKSVKNHRIETPLHYCLCQSIKRRKSVHIAWRTEGLRGHGLTYQYELRLSRSVAHEWNQAN